ncbi:hypothetical protein D9M72_21060 [compost metagenome]
MSLFSASLSLEQLVSDNGWAEIPEEFVTREGKLAIFREGRWFLPCETRAGWVNTQRFGSPILKWLMTKYMIHTAQVTSSINSVMCVDAVYSQLKDRDFFKKSAVCTDPQLLRPALIEQMEIMLARLKIKRKLWDAYRPIRWYLWGAENYPELGFCESYASELDTLKIPGGPKGLAVRSLDPEQGPLHPHLEVSLIAHALRTDTGTEFVHYQQRAAVALANTFGRNAGNFIALREEDIYDELDDPEDPAWVIRMPRIKKGFRSARSDFILESLDKETHRHVQELVRANQAYESIVEVNDAATPCARPLFRLATSNHMRLQTGDYESAFHIYTAGFGRLLRDFAERMDLISPITKERMILSARRFRYTVGTTYAAMGVSRRELAHRLDHSDEQHVQIYYDIMDVLTYALDKAAVLDYSRYVHLFCGSEPISVDSNINNGNIIVTDAHSQPGDVAGIGACGLDDLCHKFPPFSCYLCPKFRPYKSAIHELLLDALVRKHNERPEAQALGVHRVDVICAIGEVVKMCQEGAA